MSRDQGATAELEQEAAHERVERIDFKMVTFSLAGKDYGIDIMKIKEIAKFGSFTYVPNAMPFVRGVYNLRGDIISVIDLRLLFHLPIERKAGAGAENGLILRLNDAVIGVIVDSIDKVVGISAAEIKPPHPIFGDINIQYISGVVEHLDRLYIILEVEKILGKEEQAAPKGPTFEEITHSLQESAGPAMGAVEPDREFIVQTLATFAGFFASELNSAWIDQRYEEWKRSKRASGADLQLKSVEDARDFLTGFYSPHTGRFWPEPYAAALEAVLPDIADRMVQVWNPGCGSGWETYSLAGALMRRYPNHPLKIWANDNDLLNVATAPNLVVAENLLPAYLERHAVKGKNGLTFGAAVRDAIFFEYHDVLHSNQYPPVDVIVARDLVSFLKPADQRKTLEEFQNKLKPGGLLVLGANERPIDEAGWENLSGGELAAFKKRAE